MNKYTKLSIYVLSILVSIALVPQAAAEEINATGNGADSQTSINIKKSSNTQSSSENTMNVNNNVSSQAETGGNSTNNTSNGETAIVTGNAETSSTVATQGNINDIDAGCCATLSSTTTVNENGAESTTQVTRNEANSTNIRAVNHAVITNNIKIKANTGNNTADFNDGGDVFIKTGNIKVRNEIVNGPINVTKIKVKEPKKLSSYLKIAGNGAFADTFINENVENETYIEVDNFASLFNNVEALMNTGNNSADYNTDGDVTIVTGSIDAETIIKNIANLSLAEVVCGDCDKKPEKPEEKPEEKPAQPESPAPSTNVGGPGGGGSNSSNSSSGSSPAAVSTTLPVTGNNLLYFFMLANIMMLILGTYLRLRAGRSPGMTLAI